MRASAAYAPAEATIAPDNARANIESVRVMPILTPAVGLVQ